MNRDSTLDEVKGLVRGALIRLYEIDTELFKRKQDKMMHELCFTFRFAHHLQNIIGRDFFVDSHYDSSFKKRLDEQGNPVLDEDGNVIYDEQDQKYFQKIGGKGRRYVDIIVHKREASSETDFICFELKKWTTDKPKARRNDSNKLVQLTTTYHYKYGFYLVLGKEMQDCRWIIFHDGEIEELNSPIVDIQQAL